MAFSKFERRSIEDLLTAYCKRRAPPLVRDRLRVLFRLRGESVTLLESQPSLVKKSQWIEIVVAQFRRDQKTGNWVLYCADRNSKWHLYRGLSPKKTLRPLLAEVDRGPTGIFWG